MQQINLTLINPDNGSIPLAQPGYLPELVTMSKKSIYPPRKLHHRATPPADSTSRDHLTELLNWWADIFENSPIGAAVIDLQNRTIRSANPSFAAIHGFTVADLIGHPLLDILAPEYYRETAGHIRLANAKGKVSFETVHQRKDGSTFQVWADVTMMKDNTSSLLYRVMTKELVETKNLLEHDATRMMKVMEQVEESVMVTNLKGEIIYVNPFFEKTTGYQQKEVLGKNPRMLKSGYQHAAVYKSLWDTILAGDIWRGRLINRRKDGTLYQEEAAIFPVRDESGLAINFAAVKRDITDNIQRENEMEAISSLSSALRIAYNRDEMFPAVLEQIMTSMKVRAACLAMHEPTTDAIVIEQARGDLYVDDIVYPKVIQELSANVIKTRKPYYKPAAEYHATGSLPRNRTSLAVIGIPLVAQEEQPFGVLWVAPNHDVSKNEFRVLSLLANIVAIAISRSNMHNQTLKFAQDLAQAYEATIEGWARALEIRDKETEGHARRVANLTLELGRQLGMNEADLVNMRRGALLHDIGKMAIPDNVLLKPGPLDADEWVIMRMHTTYARELLAPIAQLKQALDIPYFHHEKYDGTGYPLGLKDSEIPLAARIFTVVDVWDALCSNRPYRQAWPEETVKYYIRSQTGKQFDPAVVDAFFELIQNKPHNLFI